MPPRRLRYLEFDGQVYLVRRNGLWTFPEASEPLGFDFEELHSAEVLGVEVAYCRPKLSRFPADWVYKDDVPQRQDVDPVVRQAVNASLARCVVGVVVVNGEGKVLMVKSNRGFTKGMWNIPGGFIDYGEHPEEAAVREVREETGLGVALGSLIGVYKERFRSPYFMYGFMYEGSAPATAMRTEPSEIEDARWMDPAEAHAATRNPFARAAFEKRFRIRSATA